jgi:hypothetical protein
LFGGSATANPLGPTKSVELIQPAATEQFKNRLTPRTAKALIATMQLGLAARQPTVRTRHQLHRDDVLKAVSFRGFNQFHSGHDGITVGTPPIFDCPDLAFPRASFASPSFPDSHRRNSIDHPLKRMNSDGLASPLFMMSAGHVFCFQPTATALADEPLATHR